MAYDFRNRDEVGHGQESDDEALHDILLDPHCRHVLEYLQREGGPVDLSTLAVHVAAGVTDSSPEDVPDDVHRRVQTFLHHGQLPALAEQGVVEYDPDRGTVDLAHACRADR